MGVVATQHRDPLSLQPRIRSPGLCIQGPKGTVAWLVPQCSSPLSNPEAVQGSLCLGTCLKRLFRAVPGGSETAQAEAWAWTRHQK